MDNIDNITTLSILKLLSEGIMDPGRGQLYDDQCFVMIDTQNKEIEEGKTLFRYPTRLDCFIILLCKEGTFKVTCNLQQVEIGPDSIFYALPGSILQVDELYDVRTSVIMFSEDFMRKINLSIQNLLPHIGTLNQLYALRIPSEVFNFMWRQVALVAESINQPPALSYYHDTVQNTIRAMAYTFISQLIQYLKEKNQGHGTAVHTHEEELFRHFIGLVAQHFRRERRISFYAEQMHLTPKYLSAVIRRASGHSPAEWITHNVLIEAKNRLRYSDMSVQEVAYSLHFPNQSFFGRWFKAQTGSSPKSYRQNK